MQPLRPFLPPGAYPSRGNGGPARPRGGLSVEWTKMAQPFTPAMRASNTPAAPIIVAGQRLGMVTAGQFLTESPDPAAFAERAAETGPRLGVDGMALTEAMDSIEIVSRERRAADHQPAGYHRQRHLRHRLSELPGAANVEPDCTAVGGACVVWLDDRIIHFHEPNSPSRPGPCASDSLADHLPRCRPRADRRQPRYVHPNGAETALSVYRPVNTEPLNPYLLVFHRLERRTS